MNLLNTFEILGYIILSGVMGMVCGLFSYFLDYCFWPGSIFKWYLPWLAKVVISLRHKDLFAAVSEMKPEDLTTMAESYWQYKILGGCAVCFNIWVAFISWALICSFSFLPWYCVFPYVMMSSWLIRKLVKAEY